MIEETLEFFGSKPSPLDNSRPSRKREGEEDATSKSVSEEPVSLTLRVGIFSSAARHNSRKTKDTLK